MDRIFRKSFTTTSPLIPPKRLEHLRSLFNYFRQLLPNRVIIAIWIVGLIFLTLLTLNDFLPLYDDYAHRNVATNIEVKKEISSRPPAVSVCLPYYSGALTSVARWVMKNHTSTATKSSMNMPSDEEATTCRECEALRAKSWDIWNTPYFVTPNCTVDVEFENSLAIAFIRKVTEMNSTSKGVYKELVLDRANFNWNQPIVDAFWKLFVCINLHDIMFVSGTKSSDLWAACSGFNFSRVGNFSNTQLNTFHRLVVEALETYLISTVTFDADVGPQPSSVTNRAVIKANRFCFQLSPNSTNETFTFYPIPNDPDHPPWERIDRSVQTKVTPDDSILSSIVNYVDALYITDATNLARIKYERVYLGYALETKVREKRPEEREKCMDDLSPPIVCVAKKQLRQVFESCGCMPFPYRHLLPKEGTGLPYCDQHSSYTEKCTQAVNGIRPKHQAICDRKCEYNFYRWNPYYYASDDSSSNQTFGIEFANLDLPYLSFAIETRDTSEKFLSQIGGIVNLYLGFSGVSLCWCVTFCLEKYKKWNEQHQQVSKIEERRDESRRSREEIVGGGEPVGGGGQQEERRATDRCVVVIDMA